MAKDLKQNNRNTIITTEKKEALRAHRGRNFKTGSRRICVLHSL